MCTTCDVGYYCSSGVRTACPTGYSTPPPPPPPPPVSNGQLPNYDLIYVSGSSSSSGICRGTGWGTGLSALGAQSGIDQCASRCDTTPGCTSFEWGTSDSLCYLFAHSDVVAENNPSFPNKQCWKKQPVPLPSIVCSSSNKFCVGFQSDHKVYCYGMGGGCKWNSNDCNTDQDCSKYNLNSARYTDGDLLSCVTGNVYYVASGATSSLGIPHGWRLPAACPTESTIGTILYHYY